MGVGTRDTNHSVPEREIPSAGLSWKYWAGNKRLSGKYGKNFKSYIVLIKRVYIRLRYQSQTQPVNCNISKAKGLEELNMTSILECQINQRQIGTLVSDQTC